MILDFGYLCMEFEMNLSDTLKFPSTVTSENSVVRPGGHAINQAIAAARSGAKISAIGCVGNDIFGKNILDKLRMEGIHTSGVAKSTLPTGVINSIIDHSGHKASILSSGANADLSDDQIADTHLGERTLIMLQNDTPTSLNLSLMKRAKKRNTSRVLSLGHERNIEAELVDIADICIVSAPVLREYKSLFSHHGVVICIDKNGAFLADERKNQDSVINSTAFDAFCGTFSACIQARTSINSAIQYGNTAAKLASEHGTLPYLSDIEDKVS